MCGPSSRRCAVVDWMVRRRGLLRKHVEARSRNPAALQRLHQRQIVEELAAGQRERYAVFFMLRKTDSLNMRSVSLVWGAVATRTSTCGTIVVNHDGSCSRQRIPVSAAGARRLRQPSCRIRGVPGAPGNFPKPPNPTIPIVFPRARRGPATWRCPPGSSGASRTAACRGGDAAGQAEQQAHRRFGNRRREDPRHVGQDDGLAMNSGSRVSTPARRLHPFHVGARRRGRPGSTCRTLLRPPAAARGIRPVSSRE